MRMNREDAKGKYLCHNCFKRGECDFEGKLGNTCKKFAGSLHITQGGIVTAEDEEELKSFCPYCGAKMNYEDPIVEEKMMIRCRLYCPKCYSTSPIVRVAYIDDSSIGKSILEAHQGARYGVCGCQ